MAEPELRDVVARNIRALVQERRKFEARKSRQERIADAITRFTGSMAFVYLHATFFGGWLLLNSGIFPWIRPWDPFPFVMLAMEASVEAIFLSTFVLISQNRMQELADRRADLDLHINLLAEHEVTKLLAVADAVATKLGIESAEREVIDALKKDVEPEAVLREIEAQDNPRTHTKPTSR